MSARRLVVAFLCLASLVTGCSASGEGSSSDEGTASSPSTTSAAPAGPTTIEPVLGAPTPTFEALSDAFTYGDDPGLDQLWDECAGGAGRACDDLYYAAPIDSEYETFGLTCGNRSDVIICTDLDELSGAAPPTTDSP